MCHISEKTKRRTKRGTEKIQFVFNPVTEFHIFSPKMNDTIKKKAKYKHLYLHLRGKKKVK